MSNPRIHHPLFGPNRFKLGIFSANCDGGLTMSLAPERWPADWDDIVAMTKIADEAGIEFILPVAKWRGYQGKANIYGRSFETLTHGAALGALTKRIAIFSTVHVPLVTPAFAAKAIATIDHISHGRAGLNIVCGWNQAEFDLHGVTIDPDTRYDHGLEWFQVWSRLLQGGPEFDWDGRFFKLKRLQTDPVSVQRPWPVVMSAGFSPRGRDFAARAADVLFLNVTELDQVPALLADVAEHAARHGRAICGVHHGPCRLPPDPARGRGLFRLFRRANGRYRRPGTITAAPAAPPCRTAPRRSPARWRTASPAAGTNATTGAYPGSYPFVGSPDDVAEEMAAHERDRTRRLHRRVRRLPEGDPVLRAGGAAAAGTPGGAGR